jgi:hypothetical protein
MRSFFAGLSVLLISFAVGAVALELVVRLAYSDGSNFDIEMWRYANDLKQVSPIRGVGHEHRPGTSGVYTGVPVAINSAGLRDREYPVAKPAGAVRILMLGDSVTFGWGAPEDGTTSTALERRLNAGDGPARFEVINTGVGNTNTAMQVAYFLNKGARFQPDVVVLNYFIRPVRRASLATRLHCVDSSPRPGKTRYRRRHTRIRPPRQGTFGRLREACAV